MGSTALRLTLYPWIPVCTCTSHPLDYSWPRCGSSTHGCSLGRKCRPGRAGYSQDPSNHQGI